MMIAISGTPGTGKTEVAKRLAEKLGWRYIDLNKVAEEKNLYCGYDEKRDCKIVDTEKIAKSLEGLAGDLVIESHYAHDMPADFIIFLRAKPGVLRDRLKEKGWKERKVEENVLAEIMEVCKTEALDDGKAFFEFDTTGKKPEKVVQEIVKALKLKMKKEGKK